MKYITDQISFFLDTNASSEVSSLTLWDTLKAYLRGTINSFLANKNSSLNKRRLDILNQIHSIDNQYAKTPKAELCKKRLGLQTKFDLHSTYQAETLLLRTKSDHYEHSEKSGKLLANQLRGLKAKQIITKICRDDGVTTSDATEINETFKNSILNYTHLIPPPAAATPKTFCVNKISPHYFKI